MTWTEAIAAIEADLVRDNIGSYPSYTGPAYPPIRWSYQGKTANTEAWARLQVLVDRSRGAYEAPQPEHADKVASFVYELRAAHAESIAQAKRAAERKAAAEQAAVEVLRAAGLVKAAE